MSEIVGKVVDAVKGLSLANVLVIILLVVVAVPAYVGWKVTSDPALMALVFNDFAEIPSTTDCNLFRLKPTGGSTYYAISNQFSERNAESWAVTVRLKFLPDDEAMKAYCGSLEEVIDYLRDPVGQPLPSFPGSSKPIFIRAYHPGKDGP